MEKEKKLALELLRVRRDGFPSPLVSIFGKKKVHLLRYAVFGGLAYMLWSAWADVELRGFLFLAVGIMIGGILKEMAFFKKIGDAWPFTEKVTDWSIVSNLAGEQEEEANSAPAAPPSSASE